MFPSQNWSNKVFKSGSTLRLVLHLNKFRLQVIQHLRMNKKLSIIANNAFHKITDIIALTSARPVTMLKD